MADASKPTPVKLICGIIAGRQELLTAAADALAESFGPVELTGEVVPFDLTTYYADQMGQALWRQFVAFGPLADPQALAEAKCQTNDIESRFAQASQNGDPPRPVNLDVGYVTASKLVLASMKNFAHRIYLDRGVYGEVTLLFRGGIWEPLEWTFPDYALGQYDEFLSAARNRLREQLRETSD